MSSHFTAWKNTKMLLHRVLILQIINTLLFVSIFYLFDFGYSILGHDELIFKNINTVKSYERVLYRQVSRQIEPFIQITIILIFIFQCYLLRLLFVNRKTKLIYYIFYLINIIITNFTLLIIIFGIFSMMRPSILG